MKFAGKAGFGCYDEFIGHFLFFDSSWIRLRNLVFSFAFFGHIGVKTA